MSEKKNTTSEPAPAKDDLADRVHITSVIVDTPSLLNMIKHCQDKKGRASVAFLLSGNKGVQGSLIGSIKNNLGAYNIFINNTEPDGNKKVHTTIKQLTGEEQENKKQEETKNQIGFYTSCELGQAFTHENLVRMIVTYRMFRNSIMVVYDLNKSQYGQNPLRCYRLSSTAISALNLNNISQMTDQLVQDEIRKNQATIANFFEEVPMKIQRSHLLQAFLFDHIQPHMPSFNTNMFNMAVSDSQNVQYLYQACESSQVLLDELNKIEGQHRKMK